MLPSCYQFQITHRIQGLVWVYDNVTQLNDPAQAVTGEFKLPNLTELKNLVLDKVCEKTEFPRDKAFFNYWEYQFKNWDKPTLMKLGDVNIEIM